jgi:hypothetical protein
MSKNNLNMSKITYFPWKGKTFNQITTILQQNRPILNLNGENHNLFLTQPLKIYRREIASVSDNLCNSRVSLSIDEFTRPNGYLITNDVNKTGLANTLDINIPNDKTDLYTASCDSTTTCISQQHNALKRVRSSGMIPKKFNVGKNNDTYYTSTQQYLNSRNRTFLQNQFNYIRQGNPSAEPGSPLAIQNIYSANGLNHCQKYQISAAIGNNTFSYTWVDNTTNVVVIPDGYYDLDALLSAFQTVMIQNTHYYVNNSNQSKSFLLNINYNTLSDLLELQCFLDSDFPSPTYSKGGSWTPTVIVEFIIPSSFTPVIGFLAGNYSAASNSSTTSFGVRPLYVQTYYKPNNYQFGQQGAVSASDLLLRLKYDTITTTGASLKTPSGATLANSLAYAVPENGYLKKGMQGFPMNSTPIINPYDGSVRKCIYRYVY